ncbi:uncharacterized protein BDR25DRAFT_350700 [Lindgomyces ingoldianus]|uniref:Uncharacterized protein n=1 Tax=Lindgomyces ingoldianus TaxID=673940 RepID=A0ACB6RAD7_9PLEO|nr:uncharacterized protein BDR25DRAFT_350700 [Lindgomyces ingoldianus]KAF2475310.1 hypothetical protein BDR25DRAFT_350700 [Lindgomyces ingoldianus]
MSLYPHSSASSPSCLEREGRPTPTEKSMSYECSRTSSFDLSYLWSHEYVYMLLLVDINSIFIVKLLLYVLLKVRVQFLLPAIDFWYHGSIFHACFKSSTFIEYWITPDFTKPPEQD